ncbi:MAG: hypothetical protein IT185_08595, partial [Acidobacteria bacterium]|nr:hypothetical protein [Acidobacteriota bacterium]
MSRARIMGSVVAVLVLGAGGYSAWRFASVSTASGSGTTSTIVTERVTRGSLSLDVHLDGDLRAAKSVAVP